MPSAARRITFSRMDEAPKTPENEDPTAPADGSEDPTVAQAGEDPTVAQPGEESTAAQAAEEPTVARAAQEPAAEEPTVTQPTTVPTPAAERVPTSKKRLVGVDILIAFTTLLAVVGMMSVWANRLLFNPDQWQAQSTALLQNDSIRQTTSQYIVQEIYANVNVGGLIAKALPTQLKPLADPAAGALQNGAVSVVDTLLSRPRVQALWGRANRIADQTFITVVNGGKGPVGSKRAPSRSIWARSSPRWPTISGCHRVSPRSCLRRSRP